ncbi:hypothetical protein CFC21_017628 [Triticum aestivum]|uniref:Uncharacterized protein n=3 Tax=Triticum TaxID=4564 RepID=A0A9R1NYD2_TRITD|nr:hypothetical protein CFC21_017628 [Triticum aestivum]VAH33428.1 unnamed protein product [Triticum turgidum subsp. durum]
MTRRPSASCCELHQDHIAAPPPSSLLPSAAVAMPDAASRAPFPSPAPQDPSPRPLLEQELRLLASRQGRRRPLHLRLVLPAHRRTSASPHPSRCLLAPRFSSVPRGCQVPRRRCPSSSTTCNSKYHYGRRPRTCQVPLHTDTPRWITLDDVTSSSTDDSMATKREPLPSTLEDPVDVKFRVVDPEPL